MATRASRKARSRETEQVVADRLKEVFPDAQRVPASLPGSDILHVPGFDIEVKARRDLNLTGWLKQATARAGEDMPVVVHRPDGYGPSKVDQWPVTMPMWVFIEMVKGWAP